MTKKREIQHEGKAVENVSKATERVSKRECIKRIVSGGKKSASLAAHFQEETEGVEAKQQKRARTLPFFFLPFFAGGEAEKSLL